MARRTHTVKRAGLRTTLEGKFFIVVTFMIGFAAYNTATNLLYLIFSIMLSLLIVSAVMSQSTIRGIRAERLMPTHALAGEGTRIHLTLRNTKRVMPSLSLHLVDMLNTGVVAGQAYAVRLAAGRSMRTSYEAAFPGRGLYVFSHLLVTTRYPFGFIEKGISFSARQEFLVYPALIDMGSVLTESQLNLGEVATGRRGYGSSLHGLREYSPDDPARHIHWKATAKSPTVVVREFEREEKKRVNLFLDNALTDRSPEALENFEWAVSYTASLAKFLIDRDYQIQLITHQGRVPFGSGVTHFHRILRCLAIVELASGESPLPPYHAFTAADSTNIFLRHGDDEMPQGFDQVLDTTAWRPPEIASAVKARVQA